MDFDAVYRENAEVVYRYLFSLCRDAGLSEELTQQTFYEAIRHARQYRGESALSTYLCGIAKNLLRQEWKHRSRLREVPLEEAGELAGRDGAEEETMESVHRQTVFARIHALPERQREVVYLRLSGELSFAAIGRILGESETWARVTFYRAKQALMKGEEA